MRERKRSIGHRTSLVVAVLGWAVLTFGIATPAAAAEQRYPANAEGFDVSQYQCGNTSFPEPKDFGIVQVTAGQAMSHNPCLVREWAWATKEKLAPSAYIFVSHGLSKTGPKRCVSVECQLYNYGYETAGDAWNYAFRTLPPASARELLSIRWWVDVEGHEGWTGHPAHQNVTVIEGALAFFHAHDIPTGVYSDPYEWSTITGNWRPNIPAWLATGPRSRASAVSFCAKRNPLTAGALLMVQWVDSGKDRDHVCR